MLSSERKARLVQHVCSMSSKLDGVESHIFRSADIIVLNEQNSKNLSLTQEMPTLAVLTYDGHRYKYLITDNFFQECNLSDSLFLILHETLHVVLGHLDRCKSLENRERIATGVWTNINRMYLNIAQDIIINEIILRDYYKNPFVAKVISAFLSLEEQEFFGDGKIDKEKFSKVKFLNESKKQGGLWLLDSCEAIQRAVFDVFETKQAFLDNCTCERLYYIICDVMKDELQKFLNSIGMTLDEFIDSMLKSFDSGNLPNKEGLLPFQVKITQEQQERLQECEEFRASSVAGNSPGSSQATWVKENVQPVDWLKKFRKVISKGVTLVDDEIRWTRVPRRLNDLIMFSNFRLPDDTEEESNISDKYKILFWIDMSGSISEQMRNTFLTMLDDLRKHSKIKEQCEITAFAFDVRPVKIVIKPDDLIVDGAIGGGTDIACVYQPFEGGDPILNSQDDNYDVIFCLTDGATSGPVPVKDPSRWFIFLTKDGVIDHFHNFEQIEVAKLSV